MPLFNSQQNSFNGVTNTGYMYSPISNGSVALHQNFNGMHAVLDALYDNIPEHMHTNSTKNCDQNFVYTSL